MSLSRDEAREIAALALGLVISLRIGAGVLQAIEELSGPWTAESVFGRFLAPVGSTMGMLTLALTLLLVLSPRGSIELRAFKGAKWLALIVAILGVASVFNSLALSPSSLANRLWFSAINGSSAAVLGASSYWILMRFDTNR